jgi:hypothetical protein
MGIRTLNVESIDLLDCFHLSSPSEDDFKLAGGWCEYQHSNK